MYAESMGLTKDYSLAIIPRFLNLLVVPERPEKKTYSLFVLSDPLIP